MAGGTLDARINLDDLDELATDLRSLASALEGASAQQAAAVADLDAVTERVGLEVRRVTGEACVSPLSGGVRTAWSVASGKAADVRYDLGRVGDGLDAAVREARLLAGDVTAARTIYEGAERSVFSSVTDVVRRGLANVDYVGLALDVLTNARAAASATWSPLAAPFTWAMGARDPLTRAGTADLLTDVTDLGFIQPLTWLRTRKTRAELATPAMVAQPAVADARRAGTSAEALRTLEAINRDARDGAVGIQRNLLADGSSAWVVYIPGSEGKPDPRRKDFYEADHARSYANNTGLLRGTRERSLRAVEAAMAAAGIRAGEKVVFVGHSQGGIIATRLAAERGDGGLITVGSPSGGIDLPPSVVAAHYETAGDLVHALDGRPNPATPSRTTINLNPAEALGTPHAAEDSRHAIGNGARVAEALEGSTVTAAIDGVVREVAGHGHGHGPVQDLIPGGVAIYAPQSS
ncbi:hypothetical protein ACTVCO_00035 [Sanguibacter sp. A247]|uniref:hypothetical protein n=1 Tax=unclassified Sanguibacter TaxID=2645534 RepID=UPI003FD88541